VRNTAAQTGKCDFCRKKIVRNQPRQLWRSTEGELALDDAEYCPFAPNHAHKLMPLDEETPMVDAMYAHQTKRGRLHHKTVR
jgi:hypothetical protein